MTRPKRGTPYDRSFVPKPLARGDRRGFRGCTAARLGRARADAVDPALHDLQIVVEQNQVRAVTGSDASELAFQSQEGRRIGAGHRHASASSKPSIDTALRTALAMSRSDPASVPSALTHLPFSTVMAWPPSTNALRPPTLGIASVTSMKRRSGDARSAIFSTRKSTWWPSRISPHQLSVVVKRGADNTGLARRHLRHCVEQMREAAKAASRALPRCSRPTLSCARRRR